MNENVLPARSYAEATSAPIDTATQDGIASLEDVMTFAVDKLVKARHLDDVATYLAASGQRDGSTTDGTRLAEIVFESLKEDLAPVLEDCAECGLATGLEDVEAAQRAASLPTTAKAYSTQVFRWLAGVTEALSEYLKELDTKAEREYDSLSKRLDVLVDKARALAPEVRYKPQTKLNQSTLAILLYQAFDSAQGIAIAGRNWHQALEQVLLPYMEQVKRSITVTDTTFKSGQAPTPAQVTSTPIATTVEGETVLANLTGGFYIARAGEYANKTRLVLKQVELEPSCYELPELSATQLQQALESLYKLVLTSTQLHVQIAALNDAEREAFTMIRTLIAGSWTAQTLDLEAFECLTQALKASQLRLRDFLVFLNQVAHLLALTLAASLDILAAYIES